LNLAFARFAGAIFGSCSREFKKKQKQDQKQLGIRFAHQLFFLATLGLGIKLGKFAPIRDALYLNFKSIRKLVIRERDGQIFSVRS
jgi:hypothetical protein